MKHNTTPTASASRHTPEPWYQRDGRIYAMVEDDEILIADTAPDNVGLTEYDEANAEHICQLHNALAGLNPEAVKDVVGLLSEIEQLLVMDAPQPPWIPGGRAKGLPERIRAELAALKGSK